MEEETEDGEGLKVNKEEIDVLENFKRAKNKYLKMQSLIWDKINSITQKY